ncbi:hypothetical protein [Sphingomonas dokdonensis]|uniref:Uncharacterized protein n=1 Tax=Sphingomonas dokdonensis TaxID=344880 RepID=A0A245ZVY4_9SPHN|nr:hypothetical protein [Sphingomonas dokdonensis]OWK33906.1 hypothetical protein SPDO_07950 [Sphingomonas dokdonensis]
MLRSVIGALVDKEIDQRDGRGGLKGAAIGMLAARAVTRTGPLGLMLGGGYIAKKMLDRRRAAKRPVRSAAR